MGRVEPDAPQHPPPETIDDAPPLDDDLYEPPSDYQPPPQAFPTPATSFPPPGPQGQDDHPATAFPPPQDHHAPAAFPPPQEYVAPQPFPPNHPAATAFPPSQDHHAAAAAFPPRPFPPPSPQAAQHFQMHAPTQQAFPNHYVQQQQQNVAAMQQQTQQQTTQFQTEPWKSNLFDCMKNPQNAIITLFFPCVTFGQIAEILDSGTTTCGTSGMIYSLIMCCIAMPCLMSCSYRSKLRSKYGLIESPAPDWVIHCFCECCALCQEYRELQDRGFDPTIGWMGNVARQQQQQFGMTPPMHQRMM